MTDILGDPNIAHKKRVEYYDDVKVGVDFLIENRFKKELIRGKYRYVLYTFENTFNMYSEELQGDEKEVKVYPQWMLDTLSESEIERILEYVENLKSRFEI